MYNKYKLSKFSLFFLSLLFTLSLVLPTMAADNSDFQLLAASSGRIANPISLGRFSLASVPAYSGKPYAVINKNVPFFTKADRVSRSYEKYSSLDNMDAEKGYIQGRFDAVPFVDSTVMNLKQLLED